MTEIAHKLIMLKPMQTGVSGYARLQAERGRGLAQINARGLSCAALRAFWYAGDGWVKELGTVSVNPKGEAALQAELPWARYAPERLQALLLVEDGAAPRPLLIGLCASQSAGSLLDAKNASLSLCDKLKRERTKHSEPGAMDAAGSASAPSVDVPSEATSKGAGKLPENPGSGGSDGSQALQNISYPPALPGGRGVSPPGQTIPARTNDKDHTGASFANAQKTPEGVLPASVSSPPPLSPPRDIFLPAIDPSPYIPATEEKPVLPGSAFSQEPPEAAEAVLPPPRQGVPVERLPALRWPKAFAGLREHFQRLVPCRVLDLPGWRFVCVSQQEDGLWIGFWQQDGAVRRVAYAMRGEPARDDGRPYQRMTGVDGRSYRVLIQRA